MVIQGPGKIDDNFNSLSPIERVKLYLKMKASQQNINQHSGALSFNGDPSSVKVNNMFADYWSQNQASTNH